MIDSVETCFEAAREERDASLEAQGIEVLVPAGTVPRRPGAGDLPQPPRALLSATRSAAAERLELLARVEELSAELERDAVALYEKYGVAGTTVAEMTGMSRKWLYACLGRAGVHVSTTTAAEG